jgi:hypothetical protein
VLSYRLLRAREGRRLQGLEEEKGVSRRLLESIVSTHYVGEKRVDTRSTCVIYNRDEFGQEN